MVFICLHCSWCCVDRDSRSSGRQSSSAESKDRPKTDKKDVAKFNLHSRPAEKEEKILFKT